MANKQLSNLENTNDNPRSNEGTNSQTVTNPAQHTEQGRVDTSLPGSGSSDRQWLDEEDDEL